MPKSFVKNAIVLGLSSLGLLACAGPDSGHQTGTGLITLDVTDAPIDSAKKVMVQFSSVELHGAENKTITLDPPVQLNLLDLAGSNSSALLDSEALAVGNYQWIKLGVDTAADLDTYIELDDGTIHELDIPSGSTSGLKLVRGFTVAEGNTVDFTVDFDLRKSIVSNNQGYKLKPALRLVDNVEIGHVKGVVGSALLQDQSCTSGNSVYVFEGADATLSDVSSTSNVLTTTSINLNNVTGNYEYEVGFLNAGDYIFAVTCQSGDDDPEVADSGLTFAAHSNVTVEVKKTTTVDF
ncbi:MAG: DUF4382 domain-containing protein [Gammaproteobacteria bacterium]|nr:DUF4382 domain-containing protein [Gammaproteobacteria bacterium]